jgi:hypothetical protein
MMYKTFVLDKNLFSVRHNCQNCIIYFFKKYQVRCDKYYFLFPFLWKISDFLNPFLADLCTDDSTFFSFSPAVSLLFYPWGLIKALPGLYLRPSIVKNHCDSKCYSLTVQKLIRAARGFRLPPRFGWGHGSWQLLRNIRYVSTSLLRFGTPYRSHLQVSGSPT